MRPILASLFGLGGFSAWAAIDGVLGTLAALLGVAGAVLGIFWGWRSHRAKMKAFALEQEVKRLEIERLQGVALFYRQRERQVGVCHGSVWVSRRDRRQGDRCGPK